MRRDLYSVDLYWLPLGAGAVVVQRSGRIFEALVATYQRREQLDLYHSALDVRLNGERFVIEMAPVWGNPQPERGVVTEGAVGHPFLGHCRYFRYEVRRWRDGIIPDAVQAVESPRRLSANMVQARRVFDLVPSVPTVTWGRDELQTGDMWNSNSLTSWLLARTGHNTEDLDVPSHGRAPGWAAGLGVANREPLPST